MASFAYRDSTPGDIQAPLSLLFQRRSILKLFKRLTVGYALPGTPLDIRQKARVLWQSLSQCSEHVTPAPPRIISVFACMRCAHARACVNGTDIRTSCLPHPLIVDCLLAPPTLLTLGAHARGLQYSFCLSVCVSVAVCLCVCFPYSGTSRNQAYKQQYQRLQRDTGMKYKKGFFFKTLRSEVMASFTHLE